MKDDKFYMIKAKKSADYSTCKKRHVGCIILLSDGRIVTGYNGPPYSLSTCNPCPRLNSKSGTDLHLCRAVHAERRAMINAARWDRSIIDSTLYLYTGVPCKDCLIELIEAGVKRIVCLSETYYDDLSKEMLKEWIENGGIFSVCEVI